MTYVHIPYYCPIDGNYYALPEAYVSGWVNPSSKQIDTIPKGADGELEDLPDDFVYLSDDEDEAYRVLAVRIHEDEWNYGYEISLHDDHVVRCGRREWRVLTDEEADKAADEHLDEILDEVILDEIPKNLHRDFNREAWKEDVLTEEGRGPSLATYDGDEIDVDFPEHETLYVYRTN